MVVGLRVATGHNVAGFEEAAVAALAKLEQVMPSHLRHRVDAVQTSTLPLPGRGRPAGRRRDDRAGRPGVPRARTAALRLRRRQRRGHRPAGRAVPPGPRQPPLVPRGLRPVAGGLAQLPARPHRPTPGSPARGSSAPTSPTPSPWSPRAWRCTPTTLQALIELDVGVERGPRGRCRPSVGVVEAAADRLPPAGRWRPRLDRPLPRQPAVRLPGDRADRAAQPSSGRSASGCSAIIDDRLPGRRSSCARC